MFNPRQPGPGHKDWPHKPLRVCEEVLRCLSVHCPIKTNNKQMKKLPPKQKLINAFQVQSIAAKESDRNKARLLICMSSSDFEMTEKCRLIDDWSGRITDGLIGWSCSKANVTWKQPSSQSVKLQRGGSFIWNTRESGLHLRGGNHLVVTQKPNVITWKEKPIIFKAIVHSKIKLSSCCSERLFKRRNWLVFFT